MKPAFTFFLLLCLFSFVNLNYARKLPQDYWKSIMKEQPMPEAIRGLFVEEHPAANDSVSGSKFVKDFDTRPIAVIYRSIHGELKKIDGKDVRVDDHEMKAEKSFVERSKPGMEIPT
ncbi:hypothetical protein P3X46_023298 [Hevea brasiliensis]|uniref:BURP domain-containing protein n=1 Tax=Hevea brasiliensis TaxID=3981 RepID=A0ABQ9LAM5_HEVBR|nr:uncharacterized protein LOC110645867 [Hevea brasiliensis]KAJ9163653.1 hypothetical protein P3X46_023298 [Hevea brasiliensis]